MIENRTISAIAMFLLPGEIKASVEREMIEADILLVNDNARDRMILATTRAEFSLLKYSTRNCSFALDFYHIRRRGIDRVDTIRGY